MTRRKKPSVPAYIVYVSRKTGKVMRMPNPAHPQFLQTSREWRARRAQAR